MAHFTKPPTTKIFLPSTSDLPEDQQAWVKIRTKVLLGDIVAARQSGDGDIFLTGLAMLTRLIVEWNFEDKETKQTLPITTEQLNYLEKEDYEFLDKWLNDHLPDQQGGLATPEKKVSSGTSITVSTDETLIQTPQTNI